MSRPDLVLVGIPGSGKSAVAGLLASELSLEMVEVDELVESRLGEPAEEFFVSAGEAAYRRIEEPVSLAALAGPGVIALSSGAIDSAKVRAVLATVPVTWLRTSVATASRRLGLSSLGMPTLIAIRDRMDALLAERAPWYASVADQIVDTDRLTAMEVVATIRGARSLR